MANRRSLPGSVQDAVLLKSCRRCALCFGLCGDLTEKKGQIAHLDRDAANDVEDNLVFLCLPHHDAYDSKPSQSKGLRPSEVRQYREQLHLAIQQQGVQQSVVDTGHAERRAHVLAHDKSIFTKADALLSESHLMAFLSLLASTDSYYHSAMDDLVQFIEFFDQTGHHYITEALIEPVKALLRAADTLEDFLDTHFFDHPSNHDPDRDWKCCLYPDHNIDRGGSFDAKSMAFYSEKQDELKTACRAVAEAYKTYRRAVKLALVC